MLKLIAISLSSMPTGIGLAALTLIQEPPPPGAGPPPPKAKGKKGAPGDELRKTYDLLRRIRSDTGSGRTEERASKTGPTGRQLSTGGPSGRGEQGELRSCFAKSEPRPHDLQLRASTMPAMRPGSIAEDPGSASSS